jgi:hypothetical protein
VRLCETNPFWAGRRGNAQNEPNFARPARPTEEIVQNKAKLGGTGVCGQRRSAGGPWLGRGVKRAKRTQFCPTRAGAGGQTRKTNPICGPEAPGLRIGDCGLRIERGYSQASGGGRMRKTNPIGRGRPAIADWGLKEAGCGRVPQAKCAKRTQFPPALRHAAEDIVQNEAKLGGIGAGGQRPSRGAWLGRGVKCAKRTQFGRVLAQTCLGAAVQEAFIALPVPAESPRGRVSSILLLARNAINAIGSGRRPGWGNGRLRESRCWLTMIPLGRI